MAEPAPKLARHPSPRRRAWAFERCEEHVAVWPRSGSCCCCGCGWGVRAPT